MKPTAPILPLAFALLTLSGCVTRGYKLADKDAPPAVPLNLTSAPALSKVEGSAAITAETTPSVEATLHTVIVHQGPGSWKRQAYWDEYVVSITNRGEAPLVVTTANLQDGKSDPLGPGDEPWALEKLSKTWWESNAVRQTGTYLVLGAGTTAAFSVAAAGFAAAWPATWGATAGSLGGGAVVGAAAVVALPLIAGGTVFMNLHRKHQVEAEFTRRRLVLPLTVGHGQTAQGSFFFRITPSPQRLTLIGRAGSEARDVVIDLTPLAGLHLKPAPAAPADPKL